jgi:TonB-linked SusC/RagA family outer membrane protein
MKKIKLAVLFSILGISFSFAQPKDIIGKVVDSEQESLIGVSVTIKGKSVGTSTDLDGNYKINASADETLVFGYIGMKSQEIRVGDRSIINVTLEYSNVELEEVVAIGYGTVKRKDLTSAISSISSRDIENIPVTNAAQAISGKIAGVQVTQAQGSPDSQISIRVRGGISITQSNEPLYIIDGFPTEDGLGMIDPSDIASIDVLKDASATAIYGSRGANGVILITTKGGQEGKATVNFDAYVGFKNISKFIDVLNPLEYTQLQYENAMLGNATDRRGFVRNYGTPDDLTAPDFDNMYNTWAIMPTEYNRPGVDWQKEVFDRNTPLSQNYKVSVNGGNKTTKYAASYARNEDDGIMNNSGFKRNNIRLRFDQKLTEKLRLNANVNYVDESNYGLGSLQDGAAFGRLVHVIQSRPVYGYGKNDADLIGLTIDPYYEDDTSGNVIQNPVINTLAEERNKANKITTINGEVIYTIMKNLVYKGTIGMRHKENREKLFYNAESRQAIRAGAPYGSISSTDNDNWSVNNTLSYTRKMQNQQTLDILLGQEYYTTESFYMFMGSKNFPEDNFGLDDIGLGETPDLPKSQKYNEQMLSFFGRATYNLKEKYLATATVRADGSSKFGKDNRWGYFPSVSVAWRVSEEEFIKNLNVFSYLKVRLGYGTAGNNRIKDYLSMAKMVSGWQAVNNGIKNTYYSSQLPNPDLKWETDITANLGFDFGFVDQRIQLNVDLYNNSVKDLLLNAKQPRISGYTSAMKNIGETRNRGIEVTLTTHNIQKKNFEWQTNFNISANRNKIVALTEDADYFEEKSNWGDVFGENDYLYKVGQPTGQMYGYVCDGLYTVDDFDGYDAVSGKYILKPDMVYDHGAVPQPGSWKLHDVNDDGEITSADKKVIGNANPDFFGGMTNTFIYNGIDFSFAMVFQTGNEVYNANKMFFSRLSYKGRNVLGEAANRFTYIDENGQNVFSNPAELARINEGKTMVAVNESGAFKLHSHFIEDGSFLRFTNFTLGYSFPKKILKQATISKLRVYATAHNLLTLTKYSGYDPEVNTKPNGGMTPGVDWGAYPRAFSMVFGFNLTF